MSFFNNMGNNVDITNVKVSRYISGTPRIDKWKNEKFIPFVDAETVKMSKHWKEVYKNEMWRAISEGLTEDMIDDNGCLDPNVHKIINIKINAFRDGWIAATSDND